jgi:hypothetical protein
MDDIEIAGIFLVFQYFFVDNYPAYGIQVGMWGT